MDVPATLRAARERAALSQAELAARARTSQATVSAYESGHKAPSVDTLDRLLAVTGLELGVTRRRAAVAEPSRGELARAGRTLVDVIELAAALPTRHAAELRYPRLRRNAA